MYIKSFTLPSNFNFFILLAFVQYAAQWEIKWGLIWENQGQKNRDSCQTAQISLYMLRGKRLQRKVEQDNDILSFLLEDVAEGSQLRDGQIS